VPARVIDQADFTYSTAGMGKHAKASAAREFIIGTEAGMIYRLKKENPEKEFYPLSKNAICQNMKKTDLVKVLRALQTLQLQVTVPEESAVRARRSIERMLAVKIWAIGRKTPFSFSCNSMQLSGPGSLWSSG
jgi:quinolinate synthase